MNDSGQAGKARDELVRIIRAMVPLDGVEAAGQADALGWIASGVEIYRRVKPAIPPKHLVVYAVIVDPALRRTFLIEHRKAGRWLPTGGHVDAGEHPFSAAKRELLEETGSILPAFSEWPLLLTVQETVGDRIERHTDVTLWYTFTAEPGESFTLDASECGKGEWFDAAMLSRIDCDPHLARFMRKLGQHHR
jgi:8-oxo-dGTP diphosphatase